MCGVSLCKSHTCNEVGDLFYLPTFYVICRIYYLVLLIMKDNEDVERLIQSIYQNLYEGQIYYVIITKTCISIYIVIN